VLLVVIHTVAAHMCFHGTKIKSGGVVTGSFFYGDFCDSSACEQLTISLAGFKYEVKRRCASYCDKNGPECNITKWNSYTTQTYCC
ncbi:hypothetical protein PFISCL1PPCAC_38, partial [Pristionchus fissidentatus]